MDVCEIGLRIFGVAEVVPVKILGCLCLIDEGEADWKLIAIAITDPWAPYLNDVNDLEEKLPGLVDAIREWFRTYKIPDGKPENKFGLEGRCMNAKYAMEIVRETHAAWQNLVLGNQIIMITIIMIIILILILILIIIITIINIIKEKKMLRYAVIYLQMMKHKIKSHKKYELLIYQIIQI